MVDRSSTAGLGELDVERSTFGQAFLKMVQGLISYQTTLT
jgi:hypothetical protein